MNKKLLTAAVAGIIAAGSLASMPALAGTDKNSCKQTEAGKNNCKNADGTPKEKHSCKQADTSKNSCKH
ncbi:MAG: hypothetical protein ACOYJ2_04665 [Rickettsiales bacterium]